LIIDCENAAHLDAELQMESDEGPDVARSRERADGGACLPSETRLGFRGGGETERRGSDHGTWNKRTDAHDPCIARRIPRRE